MTTLTINKGYNFTNPHTAETQTATSYTEEEAISAILEFYKENEDDFNNDIEELDSWNGYLGDDRYYNMDELDEILYGLTPTEILLRAFYGHGDYSVNSDFCPNCDYFTFNGYGNLVSYNEKDYSGLLDEYFVKELIDNYTHLNIADEVLEIIESIDE